MSNQLITTNLAVLHSSPSALPTIDLAQLALVTGGDFWGDVGYNALNLGKATVNGLVHTANFLLPESLDVGVARGPVSANAHWDIGKIETPFKDDPLSKVGHPPQKHVIRK